MHINVHDTFYVHRSTQCLATHNMKTEIAVKPAGFKITMISEAMPVANNDY